MQSDTHDIATEPASPTGTVRYEDVGPLPGSTKVIDLIELRFRAQDDVGWKAVVSYVRTETSEWGINAKGETFGVQRDGKPPDLIAIYASNGKQGYAYVKDLDGPVPTSPTGALAQQEADDGRSHSVPVYESDGKTIIGEYNRGP